MNKQKDDTYHLDTGEVAYFWVHATGLRDWLVSTWDGPLIWIDTSQVAVKPDMNMGKPVVEVIGRGCHARYFRFEGL